VFEKRAMKAAPSSVNRQDNDSVMGRAGGAVSSFWLNICNQKLATWLQGQICSIPLRVRRRSPWCARMPRNAPGTEAMPRRGTPVQVVG